MLGREIKEFLNFARNHFSGVLDVLARVALGGVSVAVLVEHVNVRRNHRLFNALLDTGELSSIGDC